jgi:hypothetical protein
MATQMIGNQRGKIIHNFATQVRCIAAVIMTSLMLFVLSSYAQGWEQGVVKTGTISEDLFEGARTVTIRADVSGDIMALGREVTVDSNVVGDVLLMGGELLVGKNIRGNVVAAGGQMSAEGAINGDLTVLGGNVVAVREIFLPSAAKLSCVVCSLEI